MTSAHTDGHAIDFHFNHTGQVNDGRNRMKTLLRCNILIIRSGRIESTVGEGDKMREETEDWRKDTMKEELGKDTPGENSQSE